MSNRRRATRSSTRRRRPARRPPDTPGLPATKVKDPGDVVAIIPYLLGFDPDESIVVVALEGPRNRFGPCARLDLIDDPDGPDMTVDYIAALVGHHGFDPVIVAAYSRRTELADSVMHAVLRRLAADGVEVVEAIRADGSRWWSYVCDDPACCSTEGSPYDVSSSRVAAEAVVAGLSRAPSRDALRACFEPDPARRQEMVDALAAHARQPPRGQAAPVAETEVPRLVREAIDDPESLTPAQQVALVTGVQDIVVRDAAWAMMTRDNAAAHFSLWVWLLQATPDELMAPVGGLAGFAAWLSGRGVLASHSAERVLAVHPGYTMATLLLDLCERSVNPDVWTRMADPLT
jgi:hypothetical protein